MKMVQLMVELRRSICFSYSPHRWFNAAPSEERVAQVAAFYGKDRRGFSLAVGRRHVHRCSAAKLGLN
jgi:hypothetical protein